MNRKSELVFIYWIALLSLALNGSTALANECECLVGNLGCSTSCLCNRTDRYFPFVPAQDNCRKGDNSSLSSLGNTTAALQGSSTSQTALTAIKILSSSNEELLVTVWHATSGSMDQVFGSIFSRNGTLISGSQPFAVSNLARSSSAPIIAQRITILATSNGFVVLWSEGSSSATSDPLKARCFTSTGTPLNTVQTLSGVGSFIPDQARYSAAVYGSGTKIALYWTWYAQKKIYFGTYAISSDGVISVATASKQISNNPKPQVSTREIRQDYMQAFESGSTTTFMILLEDFEADYALSTLSISILSESGSSILGLTQLGTSSRAFPGAMVTLINNKYVVLWNEPGNSQYSAIRACTYDPQTGTQGTIIDFWITSNTTDMSMDLIPISSNALLFGHTQIINRPITELCYQVVTWDGNVIPNNIGSDKMVCVSGAYGSTDTSAVVWSNGQITTFWTDSSLSGSVTQMSQAKGLVDMSELGIIPTPVAAVPVSSTPSVAPVDQATPVHQDTPIMQPQSDASITPQAMVPSNDETGTIVGVVVGVGAALGGGVLVLVLLLKRRKKKQKVAELTDVKVLNTDNDDGKYISLPSAVAMNNYSIPKQKIQLKQQIASGSFGAVYAAMYNNTPVAVKVHQSNMLSTDDFLNEANLALSIKPHPNVLVTLGITQLDENTIGLVMEYCAGGSLWSQLQGHPPHSKQHVIDMLVSIASGLEHLHSNGIIHRDVAARNVLITAEGHLKLADFGMSRKLKEGDGSKTNQTIGPAASMAPESIRNGTYSKKTDVWMFGILIYEILSGKKPHGSAENLVSVAIDIRETGRIPQLDASVDSFFKQLMVKCCQFDPDHRPDFEQVIQELNDEKQKMNEQS